MNKKIIYTFSMLLAGLLFTACKNGDADFPDYEGGVSVYFANQYPVRTLVMGESEYDTSLDNAHKCQIQATMGGSYSGKDITLEIAVDNSLCDNLYFEDGITPVLPMPANYYTLSSTSMKYEGFVGKIEVQLTDAFFADPKALSTNYVIPVYIKNQVGADSILRGRTIIEGEVAQRTNAGRWDIQPMDFMLYAVKYICKYDANYCRRGIDEITADETTTQVIRHKGVENDEVKRDISTLSLDAILYPVTIDINGTKKTCNLRITFDGNDNCTITSETAGVTVTGTGSYQSKSEKKAWGNKDRDGLYLDYKIDFGDATCVTRDTLVWQSRGISKEEFSTTYKE